MKHYTSVKQSKHLLELGLKPETADFCYVIDYTESNKYGKDEYELQEDPYNCLVHAVDNIPCWSVGALLEVMPKQLEKQKYWRTLLVDIKSGRDVVSYVNYGDDSSLYDAFGDYPIEATYNMIIWLLENGYLNEVRTNRATKR